MFEEKPWKIALQVESVMFASLFWLFSTYDWAPGSTQARQVLCYWALDLAQASAVLTDDSCTWLFETKHASMILNDHQGTNNAINSLEG